MLSSVDRVVQRAGRAVVILAMVAMLALLALGVAIRTFPVIPIPLAGYDEIVELLMAWMTFLGAAVLCGEGSLYRVDVLIGLRLHALRRPDHDRLYIDRDWAGAPRASPPALLAVLEFLWRKLSKKLFGGLWRYPKIPIPRYGLFRRSVG